MCTQWVTHIHMGWMPSTHTHAGWIRVDRNPPILRIGSASLLQPFNKSLDLSVCFGNRFTVSDSEITT
jgi:hypothetical protein